MLKNIPKRQNLTIIGTMMKNEELGDTTELNNLASFIAIKMYHRFKDMQEGEAQIDFVCKRAKEMYKENLAHQVNIIEESVLL